MKRAWVGWRKVWAGVVLLGLTTADAQVVRSIEYVTQEQAQVSESGPNGTGEYRFVLDAPRTSRNLGQFLLPNGTVSIGANEVYPTLEALQGEYPPGTYTAQLEHWARPTGPPTFHTLTADFPASPVFHSAVPRITNDSWEDGALVVDPNFTLTIEDWEGRPADSMIRLELQGATGGHTRTAFGQDLTSFTFGGEGNFQLQPNSTYEGVLTFVDFFDARSTQIPGSSPALPEEFRFDLGAGNSVRFTLVTVPEPSARAIGVVGGALLFWRRRRGSV